MRIFFKKNNLIAASIEEKFCALYTWRSCDINFVYIVNFLALKQTILLSMERFANFKPSSRRKMGSRAWVIYTMRHPCCIAIVSGGYNVTPFVDENRPDLSSWAGSSF